MNFRKRLQIHTVLRKINPHWRMVEHYWHRWYYLQDREVSQLGVNLRELQVTYTVPNRTHKDTYWNPWEGNIRNVILTQFLRNHRSLSTLIFERLNSVSVKAALCMTLHKEASKPSESTQQGISPLRGNPFVASRQSQLFLPQLLL